MPIEDELTPGVAFLIERHGRTEFVAVVDAEMPRLPPLLGRNTAVALSEAQELVAKEREIGAVQPIPVCRRDFIDCIVDGDLQGAPSGYAAALSAAASPLSIASINFSASARPCNRRPPM